MHAGGPAPALHFLKCQPEIIEIVLIQEFYRPVRMCGPNRCWDRADEVSKVTLVFRCAEGIFYVRQGCSGNDEPCRRVHESSGQNRRALIRAEAFSMHVTAAI